MVTFLSKNHGFSNASGRVELGDFVWAMMDPKITSGVTIGDHVIAHSGTVIGTDVRSNLVVSHRRRSFKVFPINAANRKPVSDDYLERWKGSMFSSSRGGGRCPPTCLRRKSSLDRVTSLRRRVICIDGLDAAHWAVNTREKTMDKGLELTRVPPGLAVPWTPHQTTRPAPHVSYYSRRRLHKWVGRTLTPQIG